jgi:hypothetical protein
MIPILKDPIIENQALIISLSTQSFDEFNSGVYVGQSHCDNQNIYKEYLRFIYPISSTELDLAIILTLDIGIERHDRYFPIKMIKDLFDKFWSNNKEDISNMFQVTKKFLDPYNNEISMTQEEMGYDFDRSSIVCYITCEGKIVPHSFVYLRPGGLKTLSWPTGVEGKILKLTNQDLIIGNLSRTLSSI